MAADRLLSTDQYQYEEEKLVLYPCNNGMVCFSFADSPVAAKEIRQKIETKFESFGGSEQFTSSQIQSICEEVINSVYSNRMGSVPLQMLIACSLEGEDAQMWLYDGQGGFNVAGQFEVLGIGNSSLIRYLEGSYSWQDSIDVAQNLAVYLTHQAGEFIPGCRGINVMWMKSNYDWGYLDDNEIAARLQPMKARERNQLRKIITG
jgi:hypothetical protein